MPSPYYRGSSRDSRALLRSSPLAQHVELFEEEDEQAEVTLDQDAKKIHSYGSNSGTGTKFLSPPSFPDFSTSAQQQVTIPIWRDSEKGYHYPSSSGGRGHRRLNTATLIQFARQSGITPQRLLTLLTIALAGSYFARLLPLLVGYGDHSPVYMHHDQAYRPAAHFEPMPVAVNRPAPQNKSYKRSKNNSKAPSVKWAPQAVELLDQAGSAAQRYLDVNMDLSNGVSHPDGTLLQDDPSPPPPARAKTDRHREATLFEKALEEEEAYEEEDDFIVDQDEGEEEDLPGRLLPMPLRGGSRAPGLRNYGAAVQRERAPGQMGRLDKILDMEPEDQRQEARIRNVQAAGL